MNSHLRFPRFNQQQNLASDHGNLYLIHYKKICQQRSFLLSMGASHMLTPQELTARFPLPAPEQIQASRNEVRSLLHGNDSRIAVVVGPCSLHSIEGAIAYAKRLKALSDEIKDHALIIMRAYFEKPRTTVGWKGLLYDPDLNGDHDLEKGLIITRTILLELTKLGLPLAAEFLDPNVAPYFSDLISWGVIGSRSSTSQIHRQLASSLPMPIGIKHGTEGQLSGALNAMISAATSHTFFGINAQGRLAYQTSQGNPDTHLILRGSSAGPNYEADAVAEATSLLKKKNLPTRLLIDCSHGNSNKDHRQQPVAFKNVLKQIRAGNRHILGVMLESHIKEGRQTAPFDSDSSITDSCISWETTEKLLLSLEKIGQK